MKNHKNIGIIILFVGVFLLLFDVNIVNKDYLMEYINLWPLVLIPLAIIIYIKNKKLFVASFMLIMLSLVLTFKFTYKESLMAQINFSTYLLITLGVILTLTKEGNKSITSSTFDFLSLFSSNRLKVTSSNLLGGSIIVIFARGNINLKESFVRQNNKAYIDLFVIGGSVKITPPLGSSISFSGFNLGKRIGGVSFEESCINIRSIILFGKVEVI